MLVIAIGGSLLLYSLRASEVRSATSFALVSRESGLVFNNVFLFVAALSILLGTLYPLFIDALNLGKISVGPPYFNTIFVPLMIPLLLFAGLSVFLRWRRDHLGRLVSRLLIMLVLCMATAFIVSFIYFVEFKWQAIFGLAIGSWVIYGAIIEWARRVRGKHSMLGAFKRIPGSIYGMTIAHIGLGVCAIGIALVSIYSVEKDVRLKPGQSQDIGPYSFIFQGVSEQPGPNYQAITATVIAKQAGQQIASLHPEKRFYASQSKPLTEAAIDASLSRDLYVALGDSLDDQGSWSVRLYYKPFIRWIWLGGLLMALGGLVAVCDKRYRISRARGS